MARVQDPDVASGNGLQIASLLDLTANHRYVAPSSGTMRAELEVGAGTEPEFFSDMIARYHS